MTNKIKIGLVVLLVIIGGGFLFINNTGKTNPSNNNSYTNTAPVTQNTPTKNPIKNTTNTITTSATVVTTSGPTVYSLSQVETHNNEQSCWTIVNNNVYDLTSWISEHPGGARAILSLCGVDGTKSFMD